jgi:hypothetical protein
VTVSQILLFGLNKLARVAHRDRPGEAVRVLDLVELTLGRNDPCPCGSGKKYKHIGFSFDPKLKPCLLRLKRCSFAHRTLYAFNLNSVYAIRLYQWAKSREYLKRPHPVSVDLCDA